ncbi:hypothetical protein R8Z50_33555 [Longispora sp. K20-0274]|uniref:hypothetical protein n=1 Tax=Longispora sp. K20-0274 TaxID=3088255 RepID=UPI0039997EA5
MHVALRVTAVLALAATLTTGCGPGGKGSADAGSGAGADKGKVADATKPQTKEIGKTIWAAGLKWELKSAKYTPKEDNGYDLKIDAVATNEFKATRVDSWPDVTITINGADANLTTGSTAPPAPGESTPVPLAHTGYSTAEKPFTFEGAKIVFGAAGQQQAVVPLTSGSLVANKPVDVQMSSPLTAGRMTMAPKSVQVRSDTSIGLNSVRDLKKGARSVTFVFDLTGTPSAYGFNVDGACFRLVMPNGQTLGPETAPILAIYPDKPLYQNQIVTFVVEDGADGDYTLKLVDDGGEGKPSAGAKLTLKLAQ